MSTYKTPGVYVEEISTFPPAVAQVETAIPAFIGYTAQAELNAPGDLHMIALKIYSLKDFVTYFGGPKDDAITLSVADDRQGGYTASNFHVNTSANDPMPSYLLYYAVQMFFDNGGGQCYIVSVGTYQTPAVFTLTDFHKSGATPGGLEVVGVEDEPTMIVIPEAVKLSSADYTSLVEAVLLQCGGPPPQGLGSRFGIFDVYDGSQPLDIPDPKLNTQNLITTDRTYFGTNYLSYGAAYYPFLSTTLNYFVRDDQTNVTVTYTPTGGAAVTQTLDKFATGASANTAVYNFVIATLKLHYLKMPPSGAVAGVYAATDTARGVWKAPANVSLTDAIEPVIKVDNTRQDSMNVDPVTGKSINAIRAFTGKGTLVWGARTLDGNSNDFRYVSVRRFFIMVEQSVKDSTYWAVFEPNDANTWVKVRGMIENYLTQLWREGALAGATTKEAFYVKCGLGTTMTSDDILNGVMNVEIGMAVVHPAEFIVLKFSQLLQTS